MKKIYVVPDLEIERYTLDANIALQCGVKVTFGPGQVSSDGDITDVCNEFEGAWTTMALASDVSFYESGTVCTCYYSAGGEGYFTS